MFSSRGHDTRHSILLWPCLTGAAAKGRPGYLSLTSLGTVQTQERLSAGHSLQALAVARLQYGQEEGRLASKSSHAPKLRRLCAAFVDAQHQILDRTHMLIKATA